MIDYAHQLEQIVSLAYEQIKDLDEIDLDFKEEPEKWSRKEILGHLVDSASHNYGRFQDASSKSDLIFDTYDQVDWVKRNNYQSRIKDEILHTWKTVNRHLVILLKNLSKEQLEMKFSNHNFHKICMTDYNKNSPATLSYLVWDYLVHLEHHLSQIIPGYEKLTGNFQQ